MKYSEINLASEEDIKMKVIMSYLSNLGFNFDELDFETSLSIRLGTNEYKIDGKDKARGRIDILCKRENDNLFVLEVKNDMGDIDIDDVEQAISYARLVHPIAPFAIISNGKSTEIYNVITKSKIENETTIFLNPKWKDEFKVSIEEDLRLRYEALRNFIGYSLDNVQAFTKGQITQRMLTLIGDKENISKKYVPELFVGRTNLYRVFEDFMKSDEKCFAIVGESGVGKTNCLCDLVLRTLQDNIVLFFNGTFLSESIIDSIKSDFNWIFSQNLETVNILRNLDGLTDKNKYKIYIFIDAVDEVKYLNFDIELNDLLQKLINFPKVKICFSCKLYEWGRFRIKDGQPTLIQEYLYNDKPYELERFDENELKVIDDKYRLIFKYTGKLTEKLKNEANLGIMYRILAEVYENKELPIEFNELDLFNSYFQKKAEKINKEITYNILKEIGKTIIENDVEYNWNKFTGIVDEDALRNKLGIAITDELFPELFSHNILIRYEEQNGKKFVGFYYNKFKDYVIAILSYGLSSLSGDLFKKALKKLIEGHNGLEAVLWYINIANVEQLIVFQELYYERAYEYIITYNKILNQELNVIKDRFDPFTNNDIGIILPSNFKYDLLDSSFREIDKTKEEYIKIIDKNFFNIDYLFENFKVSSVTASRYSFMSINPVKAAIRKITEQVKKIVENAQLEESNNVGLALEKIQIILINYSENLGLPKIEFPYKTLTLDSLIPVNVKELIRRIRIQWAKRFIVNNNIEMQLKSKTIHYYQDLNTEKLEKDAINLVDSGEDFPIPKIYGDYPPYTTLFNSLKSIENKLEVVSEPYLPLPDVSLENSLEKSERINIYFVSHPKLQSFYSNEQLARYIKQFFERFFEEYRTIIERNFYRIKEFFPLYSRFPINYYVEINRHEVKRTYEIGHGIDKSKVEKTTVEVVLNPEISRLESFDGFETRTIQNLAPFFYSFKPINLEKNIYSSKSDAMCPLRNYLYEILFDEINEVNDKLEEKLINSK